MISLQELGVIVGGFILLVSMVGYLADIPPFHLHPDYSKDPCSNGNVHCMRINPEFNPIPLMVGMLVMVIPACFENFKTRC